MSDLGTLYLSGTMVLDSQNGTIVAVLVLKYQFWATG